MRSKWLCAVQLSAGLCPKGSTSGKEFQSLNKSSVSKIISLNLKSMIIFSCQIQRSFI